MSAGFDSLGECSFPSILSSSSSSSSLAPSSSSSPSLSSNARPVHRISSLQRSNGKKIYNLDGERFDTIEALFKKLQDEKGYNFSDIAMKSIFFNLGDSNLKRGEEKFKKLVEEGSITLERVGFSRKRKDGDGTSLPRFYLIINEIKDNGAFSSFHEGFTHNGKKIAVTRNIEQQNDPVLNEGIGKAHDLSKKDEKRIYSQGQFISHVKSFEDGVKIGELGSENLSMCLAQGISLSKIDRLIIYRGILEGLDFIHKNGLVHRDIKLENIVLIRNERRHIIGVKIIDFDFLVEDNSFARGVCGTPIYYSYQLLQQFQRGSHQFSHQSIHSSKEDIWAAMYLICRIENQMPSSKRIVSDEFISRFSEYARFVGSGDMIKDRLRFLKICYDTPSQNLFHDLKCVTFMDHFIYRMGSISSEGRISGSQLVKHISKYPAEFWLFFNGSKQEIEKWVGDIQFGNTRIGSSDVQEVPLVMSIELSDDQRRLTIKKFLPETGQVVVDDITKSKVGFSVKSKNLK